MDAPGCSAGWGAVGIGRHAVRLHAPDVGCALHAARAEARGCNARRRERAERAGRGSAPRGRRGWGLESRAAGRMSDGAAESAQRGPRAPRAERAAARSLARREHRFCSFQQASAASRRAACCSTAVWVVGLCCGGCGPFPAGAGVRFRSPSLPWGMARARIVSPVLAVVYLDRAPAIGMGGWRVFAVREGFGERSYLTDEMCACWAGFLVLYAGPDFDCGHFSSFLRFVRVMGIAFVAG